MASKQEQVIDISKPIVVDGTNLIAGRLCSNVAKLLRKGNRVSIVNCDKIMISGKKSSIIGEMLAKRAKEKNINEVFFDRGAYKYHGRVKIFAETLRKNGLKF